MKTNHQDTQMKMPGKPATFATDGGQAAKNRFSQMGKLSSAARRGPEHEKLRAEAIRMHVTLDYGITAISAHIGINKISIRRWLIAAGCYRAGHRPPRTNNDGAALSTYKASDLGRKQIFPHIRQRWAWLEEWKGAAKWDQLRHWSTHPAKYNYINVRRARQRRVKTSDKKPGKCLAQSATSVTK